MRRSILGFVAIALVTTLASQTMAAECAKPGVAPALPKGETATKEEMQAGKTALQKYVDALEGFQDCMEQRIKDSPKEKQTVLQGWRDEGDAAIGAANAQAALYAAQMKAFNARQH